MSQKLISVLFPFLSWMTTLTKKDALKDIQAGLTGAVIVLPQGVAYAYIAGLPPEIGLYTAIVSASVASLYGSSFHMISGPTAAMSIVVAAIIDNLIEATLLDLMSVIVTLSFLVGAIQLLFGVLRLGALISFISHTVIVGFTTGAAILIAESQIKHFVGVSAPSGLSFLGDISHLMHHFSDFNGYAMVIGATTLVTSVAIKVLKPAWPNLLIGLGAGALVSVAINASEKGVLMVTAMPGQLPPLSIPEFSTDVFSQVFAGAASLALLGLIEAIAIARAISTRSKQSIDGNQEMTGQGLSNLVGSFFSCYPSSGSFTRSGANYDSGAVSPLSAVYAAVFVLFVIVLLPTASSYLPVPAMAGSVLFIAWNLLDFRGIAEILRHGLSETVILLSTFIATLTLPLEYAIYIGILFSLIFYLRRTSTPNLIEIAPVQDNEDRPIRNIQRFGLKTCPQVQLIRIDGSIYFGSVDHIEKRLRALMAPDSDVILVAKGVNFLDSSGVHLLENIRSELSMHGRSVKLCSLKGTVLDELPPSLRSGELMKHDVETNTNRAILSLIDKVDLDKCFSCRSRVFKECADFPCASKR